MSYPVRTATNTATCPARSPLCTQMLQAPTASITSATLLTRAKGIVPA
ncbi:hypothetical protein ACNAW0_28160 [Micromonospora sp. SL1-18]